MSALDDAQLFLTSIATADPQTEQARWMIETAREGLRRSGGRDFGPVAARLPERPGAEPCSFCKRIVQPDDEMRVVLTWDALGPQRAVFCRWHCHGRWSAQPPMAGRPERPHEPAERFT